MFLLPEVPPKYIGCCVGDELTQVSTRWVCTETIHDAVETALAGDVFGVLVDALPTLGKLYTIAMMAAELLPLSSGEELHAIVLTHRSTKPDSNRECTYGGPRTRDTRQISPSSIPR